MLHEVFVIQRPVFVIRKKKSQRHCATTDLTTMMIILLTVMIQIVTKVLTVLDFSRKSKKALWSKITEPFFIAKILSQCSLLGLCYECFLPFSFLFSMLSNENKIQLRQIVSNIDENTQRVPYIQDIITHPIYGAFLQ